MENIKVTKAEMIDILMEQYKNNPYVDKKKQRAYYNRLPKAEIRAEFSRLVEYEMLPDYLRHA